LESNMKNTTLMLAMFAATAVASAQDIGVTVDGRAVRFAGQEPVMVNNSVLVPLRGVFEEMGANVRWNQRRQQVTATKDGKVIRLIIGERTADVDGRAVRLNTPAQNRNGTTLVPLRFLSESLGAQVRWNPNTEMVMIRTDAPADGRAQPIRNGDRNGNGIPDRNENTAARRDAVATMYRSTVIPVRLDTELSSNESRAGDRFTATIDSSEGIYGNLPAGTKVEGRVITARKFANDEPGLLELSFDRLIMPDGRSEDLSGTLISLNDKEVKKDAEGRIVATGKAKDNKGVYAGYGAGAGLIVGLLGGDTTKGTLTKTILGGLLGLGAGALEQGQRKPNNVNLKQGTKFGVRLDEDLVLYR
jgi:hypothetical protein